ncbi:MAG: hypothetical protein ACK40X_14305, partial [Armatimonadota bacterium]
MKKLKQITLTFATVVCCFIVIVALVSLTYPLSRLSVFRALPREWSTRLIEAMPSSLSEYLYERSSLQFAQSAQLKGFRIRWAKLGEDIVFSNSIAFRLQPICESDGIYRYALVEAFKMDNGVTLWTCSIPNPIWEKGLSTNWKLLAWQEEVWAIALSAGKISALDPKSGKLLWEHEFGLPIWEIHEGEEVVFIAHEKGVLCFEPKARQVLWEIRGENAFIKVTVIDEWLQVFT